MNPDLARQAKRYAAKHRSTFTRVVEQAVGEYLKRAAAEPARPRIVLPVSGDPSRTITEAEYRAAVESVYEEEAAAILGGSDVAGKA